MQGTQSTRLAALAAALVATAWLALAGQAAAQEPYPTYTQPTTTEPAPTEPTTTEPAPAEPAPQEAPKDPSLDVNGCGSKYFDVPDKPAGFDFEEACNKHDKCYATKGKTQKECDDQFFADLKAKCASYKGKTYEIYTWVWVKGTVKPPKFTKKVVKTVDLTDAVREHCNAWAKLYYEGVQKGGKAAYDAAQKKAAAEGGEEGGGEELGALSYDPMPDFPVFETYWQDAPMAGYELWMYFQEPAVVAARDALTQAYEEGRQIEESERQLAYEAEMKAYQEEMLAYHQSQQTTSGTTYSGTYPGPY